MSTHTIIIVKSRAGFDYSYCWEAGYCVWALLHLSGYVKQVFLWWKERLIILNIHSYTREKLTWGSTLSYVTMKHCFFLYYSNCKLLVALLHCSLVQEVFDMKCKTMFVSLWMHLCCCMDSKVVMHVLYPVLMMHKHKHITLNSFGVCLHVCVFAHEPWHSVCRTGAGLFICSGWWGGGGGLIYGPAWPQSAPSP